MTSSLGLVLKSVIYVVVGYTNIPFVVMETRWPNVLDASIVRNEMTLIWGTLNLKVILKHLKFGIMMLLLKDGMQGFHLREVG